MWFYKKLFLSPKTALPLNIPVPQAACLVYVFTTLLANKIIIALQFLGIFFFNLLAIATWQPFPYTLCYESMKTYPYIQYLCTKCTEMTIHVNDWVRAQTSVSPLRMKNTGLCSLGCHTVILKGLAYCRFLSWSH